MRRTLGPDSRFALGLLGLLLLAWVRYAWAVGISFINDDFLFLERARTSTFLGNWSAFDALGNVYRPLTRNVYFWFGLRLWGHDPRPYHVLNVTLFALGGVLCALAARNLVARVLKRPPTDGAARAAGLGAALCFVLHPAAGTPASWVCGVQDLMAANLVLAAILAHLAGRRVLYLLAYVGAVLCKETAALLFLLLALWDRWVESTNFKTAALRQLPAALCFVAWLVLNPWLPWNDLGKTIHARAPGQRTLLGRFDLVTAWIAVRSLFLAAPAEGFRWPYGPVATALQLALAALVLWLAARLAATGRAAPIAGPGPGKSPGLPGGRSAALGGIAFAIGWIASGILPLVAIISHFVYYAFYPALGLSLLIGAFCFARPRRIGLGVAAASAIAAALFLAAGIVSPPALWDAHNIRRASTHLWRFRSDLMRSHPSLPESSRVYFWNLPPWIGFQLADGPALRVWYEDPTLQGFFLSAYQPDPRHPAYFFGHDDAMNLLEIVNGLPDPALADPPPIYPDAHTDLGATLSGVGETEAALVEWRKVLQVDANFNDALANLGMTLARLGRNAEALPVLERAVAREPQAADVRLDLGRVALHLGRYSEALAALETFVRLKPDDPARMEVEQVITQLRGMSNEPAPGRSSPPDPPGR